MLIASCEKRSLPFRVIYGPARTDWVRENFGFCGLEGRGCVKSRGSPIRERHWEKFKKKVYPAERQAFLLDDKCLECSDLQKKSAHPWPRRLLSPRTPKLREKGPSGKNAVVSQGPCDSLPHLFLSLYGWQTVFRWQSRENCLRR